VALGPRTGRREEVWWGIGVHSADINPKSGLLTEEKPQYSIDLRWVIRRQARSCQRCGNQAAQE